MSTSTTAAVKNNAKWKSVLKSSEAARTIPQIGISANFQSMAGKLMNEISVLGLVKETFQEFWNGSPDPDLHLWPCCTPCHGRQITFSWPCIMLIISNINPLGRLPFGPIRPMHAKRPSRWYTFFVICCNPVWILEISG